MRQIVILSAHVVAIIPNRGSPPAILLRQSYRDANKTRNQTLVNPSNWPAERIEQFGVTLTM